MASLCRPLFPGPVPDAALSPRQEIYSEEENERSSAATVLSRLLLMLLSWRRRTRVGPNLLSADVTEIGFRRRAI